MREFFGTYVGFSPTDESAVAMGEIEAVISEQSIKVRMATGLTIQEETIQTDIFEKMSADQVLAQFKPGTGPHNEVVGFTAKGGHPIFLFLQDQTPGKLQLVVRTGGMGEFLGPTILFGPDHAEKFEEAVKAIEKSFGREGIVPRLSNSGKAEGR